jgi:hypothetical protein
MTYVVDSGREKTVHSKLRSLGMVAYVYNLSYLECEIVVSQSEVGPDERHKILSEKITETKMGGDVAQVIEHLLSECRNAGL